MGNGVILIPKKQKGIRAVKASAQGAEAVILLSFGVMTDVQEWLTLRAIDIKGAKIAGPAGAQKDLG